MNFGRHVRLLSSTILMSSLLLFSPPLLASITAHGREHVGDDDKNEGSLITFSVVAEQSQEPLVGAVIHCEGLATPVVTDINGRCVAKFKHPVTRIKVSVSYIGYKNLSRLIVVPADGQVVLTMKDDSKQLDNVTITALKGHTTVLQQSASISQEALEKGGATSLAKLLETVPGVSSISTGNTIAKPVIQGMHSSRILLMNNGVRLESQSWGADHAPELDYTGSSMVEVVKGAECIRYGFGAMGGVVLLNDAPLPYGNKKTMVSGNVNMGYDTNARGFSGSGSIEAGHKNIGLRLHGMYTKGGDYRTADYVLNNTGYNTISLSALAGYQGRKVTATLFSSIYYQRSGIYYASKISDLNQLIKRFEYGRPDPETVKPFSYSIKPPFQQSQHVTLKGELKWDINAYHHLDFTLSFQENLRQEFENRKKA